MDSRTDWRTLHKMTLRVLQDDYLTNLHRSHYTSLNPNCIYTLQRYYVMFGWTLSVHYYEPYIFTND